MICSLTRTRRFRDTDFELVAFPLPIASCFAPGVPSTFRISVSPSHAKKELIFFGLVGISLADLSLPAFFTAIFEILTDSHQYVSVLARLA